MSSEYLCISSRRNWSQINCGFLCLNHPNQCKGAPSMLTKARDIFCSSKIFWISNNCFARAIQPTGSLPSKLGISIFLDTRVGSSNKRGLPILLMVDTFTGVTLVGLGRRVPHFYCSLPLNHHHYQSLQFVEPLFMIWSQLVLTQSYCHYRFLQFIESLPQLFYSSFHPRFWHPTGRTNLVELRNTNPTQNKKRED